MHILYIIQNSAYILHISQCIMAYLQRCVRILKGLPLILQRVTSPFYEVLHLVGRHFASNILQAPRLNAQ